MRIQILGLLLALPLVGGVCLAKAKTERIEVSRGKTLIASIDGASAEEFTIWTGPNTGVISADGVVTPTSYTEGDFADWKGGAVQVPRQARTYEISFFCKACEPARTDTWRCYGVHYAPGRDGERGYVRIPGTGDAEYDVNVRTIYRGVEGQWFRATKKWDALIRARIEQAQAAERAAADAARPEQVSPPQPKTVSAARPAVAPKN